MDNISAPTTPWLLYLKWFLLVVVVVFFSAIAIRSGIAISQAHFTQNSFNILISCNQSYLVGIDKKAKKESIANFGNIKELLIGKSNFQLGIVLHVPVNAQIIYKKGSKCPQIDKNFLSWGNIYSLISDNTLIYKSINRYDLFKYYLESRNINDENKNFQSIRLDSPEIDKKITELYKDQAVTEKALSVEIVNVTSIDGLGARVSQMLTNVGYNVIGVRSESSSESNSRVVIGGTIDKKDAASIVALTNLPLVYNDGLAVSDVRLYLESDMEAGLSD